MAQNQDQIERISARLDVNTQKKAQYLFDHGYGSTQLVKEGIDLLYEQAMAEKPPSIQAILKNLQDVEGKGPADLSSSYKIYYKDKLVEKHSR